jgi:cytochrome P450
MQTTKEVTFDPTNPYPWYRYMRDNQPVYYDERMQLWYLFRYDDVQWASRDTDHFTSEGSKGNGYLLKTSFFAMDPPDHRKYRTLVSQAFTPRGVEKLESRITEIANELIDAIEHTGHIDLVANFSLPLSATVIGELFGVTAEDRPYFKQMADRAMVELENISVWTEFPAQDELAAYLLPLIEKHGRERSDHLLSRLVHAEVDGERLSTFDVQSTSVVFLMAGYETTTNFINNAFYCFTEHPSVMDELREEPDLMAGAIEEVLRYRPPVLGISRAAKVDTEVRGMVIPKGHMVNVLLASANRDERVWPDPDRFDIRRTPNQHAAFGYSVHYCIGAPLARLESRIGMNLLLKRLPNLRRDPKVPVQLKVGPGGFYQNMKDFPMIFDPK